MVFVIWLGISRLFLLTYILKALRRVEAALLKVGEQDEFFDKALN